MPLITRVTEGTLHEWAPFLLARLGKEYQRTSEASIIGWFRNIMFQNSFHFIHSTNAIHLAAKRTEFLLPTPKVDDIFSYCRVPEDPFQRLELVELLRHTYGWAKREGANLIYMGNSTDLKPEDYRTIAARPSHVGKYTLPFIEIE